ncbi:MAG: hypothetical protein Ct9H300mP24_7090 [Candidatus Neomarinimicrobiota bacterium]|nr:MAG: hypothetical protein Ct9H300mP24_7090 [Candidatus Neomarinimicrobiota bacterium]
MLEVADGMRPGMSAAVDILPKIENKFLQFQFSL